MSPFHRGLLEALDGMILLGVLRRHGDPDAEHELTKWGIEAYLGWDRCRIDGAARWLARRGWISFVR